MFSEKPLELGKKKNHDDNFINYILDKTIS